MSTPLQLRGTHRDQRTPDSRRARIVKTPQSGLTPNDDKAEYASIRRKRRSEALRKSLSDAFAGDQHNAAKATLPPEALNAMFEQCIKLAAENKITDKNVWQLDLIKHLPSIVLAGQTVTTSAFNFQKISGGLDAGVTIYSKRVDHTYKEALQTLQDKGPRQGGDADGTKEGDGGGGEEDDGVEDAAEAAAQKREAASKRSKHRAAKEEATLATAEQLKQKKVDTTFAVDPLFHKMSALFDEGGAKGLLLLNRSVYKGASIMTDPNDIPEQHCHEQSAPMPDTLINLKPLRQQIAACQLHSSNAAADGGALVLTPDMHKLLQLLEQTKQKASAQQQRRNSINVAAVMTQATRGLAPTPTPRLNPNINQAAAHPDNIDIHMDEADKHSEERPHEHADDSSSAMVKDAAHAGNSVLADFLAEAAAAGDDDIAPAGELDAADELDFDDHPGFEDEGDAATTPAGTAEGSSQKRQSLGMLGLSSHAAGDEDAEVLDAEALQQLLGNSSAGSTAASKYKAKAAAIACLGGAAAKKAPTTAGRGKKTAPQKIDFTNLPQLPPIVLGTSKQTCLARTASRAPVKLLPESQQYEVARLAQLFLRPTPISILVQQRRHRVNQPGGGAGGADELFAGDDGDGGWGGEGYEDDGYSGAEAGTEGYNAGDLSMGDPGYSAAAGGYGSDGEGAAGDWWNADSELLKAPHRAAGLGVNYNRSAKQVDVRALKDLLWDSLMTVNQQAAHTKAVADSPQQATATGQPAIPFQDVIASVPEQNEAGSLSDVSVHMCFICLLHLANEKGLVIKAKDDLKTLTIGNVEAAAV